MQLLIAVCMVAFAAAVNHHPGGDPHPPNHHPDVECHQNSDCTDPCADATESRVCLNHKCECQATPIVKRAHCNPHDCVCPEGQNGVCNSQGHCECGSHGKRAGCHPHDCQNSCPVGQNGICNSQGHCECGDHVGKRATACTAATVATDCTCDKGTAVCNEHGHCHCNECMADADCPATHCHGDHVPACDGHHKCHCKHP
ncbi:integrin beta-4-like isoform X2 [Ruditapes philippinarum]|uniref:integrin beta-4-like isoform X2 n=1 Tax=Ruditapes philippinarum TaxID=129788 RepID=UPI00295A710F|nr:integrin beta-4-like isoform X2 [Ruditapes philippinarum]